MTPALLAKARKKKVYVGTTDVDLALNLEVLANMEAYSTIENVLLAKDFKPLGKKAWQWEFTADSGTEIRIDFLADDGTEDGGKILSVPEHGQLAVCNIPHSNIVFDHLETEKIEIALPKEGGVVEVEIRYCDLVGFTVLKLLAFYNRGEDKDAHDLIYCLEHCGQSIGDIADRFAVALRDKHAETIARALDILRNSFANSSERPGFEKHGPMQAARFEPGLTADRERRLVRQRDIAGLVNELLDEIERYRGPAEEIVPSKS